MGLITASDFKSAWWLPGPHLQTLWPTLLRKRPKLSLTRERVELGDGDFIDIELSDNSESPLIIVVHGLEGSLDSHYARTTLHSLIESGFQVAFMFLRGCSGVPNRLSRSYHSGATGDLAEVIGYLQCRGNPPAAAIGFSLGGNLLLKYLGELGDEAPLKTAISISVPFLLGDSALRLNQGTSRLYRKHLLSRLQNAYIRKSKSIPSPLDVEVSKLNTFYDFDDQVTAPLNGFIGADDYYQRCSCRSYLGQIKIPTLILHSLDDPFMFSHSVPREDELGEGVMLEISQQGGHVGFVGGSLPWRARYWLDRRIPQFLSERLGSEL